MAKNKQNIVHLVTLTITKAKRAAIPRWVESWNCIGPLKNQIKMFLLQRVSKKAFKLEALEFLWF